MHQGVGRLLLDSEIRGGSIDPRATRRTAFVIAGGHALTAQHCSSDATPRDLLWLRLAAPGDEFGIVDLPVRVVDEDAALDVAVLGADPARVARGDTAGDSAAELLGRVPPLPVGLPAAAGEVIRTQGYPRDAHDGGLAFTGKVVDPAALLRKHRVYGLQLQIDELAASVPHGPGGHSGGPVLATGAGRADAVVGVVRAYPADETREYAVGGSLLASRIQDLAQRFPAVRDAFAQRCTEVLGQTSTPAMAQAPSLATLIRADARHTRFFGRERELRQLHSWCAMDAARAAVLMTGPAGQGKTRLARHLCEQLTEKQWIAVPLRGVEGGDGISAGLAMAALAQRPLLLAVDYAAEYGARHLRALVDQLCTEGPPRWRLLLIARHTGGWWDGDITTGVLAGLRAAAVEVASDPLPLAELVAAGDDRQDAYDFILEQLGPPVTAFATQHGLNVRADPPRPPLQRPGYGSALMLHIAAVCALLPDSRPGTESTDRLDPTNVVDRFLDLERDHHWLYRDTTNLHHTTVTAFGDLATGEAGRYLVETAVAAATLTGAASHRQACQLITTALGIKAQQAERIAYWLRDLYPPPTEAAPSSVLHPLQPDLLGEELVIRVLRRQLDHGISPDRLLPFALVGTSSEAQIQRMLTVLIRAAERHAWIATLLTTSGGDPGGHGGGLLDRIPLTTNLGIVENALPRQNTHLLRVAVQLTQRLLDRLDHLPDRTATGTAAPEVIAERARLLSNLAVRLAEVGERQQALPVSQEAVDTYRELVGLNRDAYLPNLAASLNNHALQLAEVGQRQQALPVSQEAVDTYRELVGLNRDAYLPDLAMSLNNHAVRLAELGQRQQALPVSQEAVDLRRELAGLNRDAYLPDLATSLNNHANRLAELGQRQQALPVSQEALDLRRELAGLNRDAYLPDLAMSLNNHAALLAELGQCQHALPVSQEALDTYRELVGLNRDAYLPNLAMSLNNHASQLAELGQRQHALPVSQEALDLRRELVGLNRDAYLPNLAASLNNHALRLAELGQRQQVLPVSQEALDVRRELVGLNREAYLPDLAMSLNNHALRLAELGQRQQALPVSQEALDTYRELAAAIPDLFDDVLGRAERLLEYLQHGR